jgi:hypothetical protein
LEQSLFFPISSIPTLRDSDADEGNLDDNGSGQGSGTSTLEI